MSTGIGVDTPLNIIFININMTQIYVQYSYTGNFLIQYRAEFPMEFTLSVDNCEEIL